MEYLLIISLFLIGCEFNPKIICEKPVKIIEVGGCVSDRNGYGSCGVLLSNGIKTNIDRPVKGQIVQKCTQGDYNHYINLSK